VLSGNSRNTNAVACVTNPEQTSVETHGSFPTIAAQCCDSDGTCRRFFGTNDDDGCLVGHSKQSSPDGAIQATTFAEAHAMCSAFGLQLCDKSCRGAGCSYNRHPVWTRLECDAVESSSPAGASALSSSAGQSYLDSALASYSYGDEEADSGSGANDGDTKASQPHAQIEVLLATAVASVLLVVALLAVTFFFLRWAISRGRSAGVTVSGTQSKHAAPANSDSSCAV